MKDVLKISLVQAHLSWENVEENLGHFENLMERIPEDTDLILLPELFTTGFTMTGEQVAESMDGRAVSWMLRQSRQRNCLIGASVLIKEGGELFNRFVAAFPDGNIKHSDKRHLFSFAGEDKVFKAGAERLVFEYRGFRICPLICYDLRFPVWSRNTENIDLLVYVANWPDARIGAWDTLAKARAIENLCYVAAVNRVGEDANGLRYVGHSSVLDAMGTSLVRLDGGKEGILQARLEKAHLDEVRNTFRFLADRDEFGIL